MGRYGLSPDQALRIAANAELGRSAVEQQRADMERAQQQRYAEIADEADLLGAPDVTEAYANRLATGPNTASMIGGLMQGGQDLTALYGRMGDEVSAAYGAGGGSVPTVRAGVESGMGRKGSAYGAMADMPITMQRAMIEGVGTMRRKEAQAEEQYQTREAIRANYNDANQERIDASGARRRARTHARTDAEAGKGTSGWGSKLEQLRAAAQPRPASASEDWGRAGRSMAKQVAQFAGEARPKSDADRFAEAQVKAQAIRREDAARGQATLDADRAGMLAQAAGMGDNMGGRLVRSAAGSLSPQAEQIIAAEQQLAAADAAAQAWRPPTEDGTIIGSAAADDYARLADRFMVQDVTEADDFNRLAAAEAGYNPALAMGWFQQDDQAEAAALQQARLDRAEQADLEYGTHQTQLSRQDREQRVMADQAAAALSEREGATPITGDLILRMADASGAPLDSVLTTLEDPKWGVAESLATRALAQASEFDGSPELALEAIMQMSPNQLEGMGVDMAGFSPDEVAELQRAILADPSLRLLLMERFKPQSRLVSREGTAGVGVG